MNSVFQPKNGLSDGKKCPEKARKKHYNCVCNAYKPQYIVLWLGRSDLNTRMTESEEVLG